MHKSSDSTAAFAKTLRKTTTEAEKQLWRALRGRRFDGYKFRRQVPIGRYIADFVCFDCRLIIELDGSQHADSAHDARRDEWLRDNGFTILRIWNNDLALNETSVLDAIWAVLQQEERR